jgi:ribosomal protein S18 acetylase RimI-like enzyme
MRVREAVVADAPAMGRVMVEAWLTGHHGQMPEEAWQKRRDEWTPEISAGAWERDLLERDATPGSREVYLIEVDDNEGLVGILFGLPANDGASREVAEIAALYVLPEMQGRGVGRQLLRAAADRFMELGLSTLNIAVLSTNEPARGFYEALGGTDVGERTFDEEGHLLAERVYSWPDLRVLTT